MSIYPPKTKASQIGMTLGTAEYVLWKASIGEVYAATVIRDAKAVLARWEKIRRNRVAKRAAMMDEPVYIAPGSGFYGDA